MCLRVLWLRRWVFNANKMPIRLILAEVARMRDWIWPILALLFALSILSIRAWWVLTSPTFAELPLWVKYMLLK